MSSDAERSFTLSEVHRHSATGEENMPCLCDQPGTYARQAPNPLDPEVLMAALNLWVALGPGTNLDEVELHAVTLTVEDAMEACQADSEEPLDFFAPPAGSEGDSHAGRWTDGSGEWTLIPTFVSGDALKELAELAAAFDLAADGPSADAEHDAARELSDAVTALLGGSRS